MPEVINSTPVVSSPTGETLPLPKWAWKAAAAVAGIAVVLIQVDVFPDHTIADKVLNAIVNLGVLVGMVSPGWRK